MADLNMEMRRTLLKQGKALPPAKPGGPPRFPIRHAGDIKDGVGLVGQVSESEKPKVRRHLIRHAKRLGAMNVIPDNWSTDGKVTSPSS